MAKFYGKVGHVDSIEKPIDSGIWVNQIVERSYYGDIVRNVERFEDGTGLNSDLTLGNSISIVADQYAIEHFSSIRYVRWAGASWAVTNVEVRSPRLILTLGNVYNGPFPEGS